MNKIFIFLLTAAVSINVATAQSQSPKSDTSAHKGHTSKKVSKKQPVKTTAPVATTTPQAKPAAAGTTKTVAVKKHVVKHKGNTTHGATHEQETIEFENSNPVTVIEVNNGEVFVNGELISNIENAKNERHKIIVKYSGEEQAARQEETVVADPQDPQFHTDRPMLGVLSGHTEDNSGAYVISLIANSAADKAGLRKGDIITKINSTKIRDAKDLVDVINDHSIGEKVIITYQRDDKEAEAEVVLGERTSYRRSKEADDAPQMGIEARDSKDGRGVAILHVKKKSPAEKAGLEEGDVIVRINEHRINSTEDLQDVINDASPTQRVMVDFYRGRKLMDTYLRFSKEHIKMDF